jgi:hypothetical protein
MPIRKQDYPPDWRKISLAARARAKYQCEWCGARNRTWILRSASPTEYIQIRLNGQLMRKPFGDFSECFPQNLSADHYRSIGAVKIILTVAHLDRDRKNNNPDNLAALCQRCHLNHDRAAQHVPNRKYGRYHDREHQGKISFTE